MIILRKIDTTTSGITKHSMLDELDYASSGHTGFSSDSHLHDDRYYTESEVNTISGTIVDQIPTTAADIIYDDDETVEHILDDTINNGVLHEIIVTNPSGLTINWTAGKLFDHDTGCTVVTTSGTDTVTNNAVNYLIWAGGSDLSLGVAPAVIVDNEINIGDISVQDGTIHNIHNVDVLNERESAISNYLREVLSVIVTSGLIVSENSDATYALDVECSAGTYFTNGRNRYDVSLITSSGTLMYRDFKTGGEWDSDLNTEIDTAYWNNGTDLAAAGVKWYKSLFIVDDDHLHWVYPTVQYNTIAQAIAGALPGKPPGLVNAPNSVALVYQGGASTLPAAGNSWIDVRPVIGLDTGAGAISDHGNLTGLDDDDHTQYHTDARGDARYYTETELDAGQLDNRYYTESEVDTISGSLQTNIDNASSDVVDDTTPQLGGDLDLNGHSIDYGAVLTSDDTYEGKIITITIDDASAVFGSALYCAADFHYERCDADAAATMPCRALALEAGTGSKKILLEGQICNTTWDWTAGDIYISGTTGGLTQTTVSGSDDQVQRVGFALSSDTIYFRPDSTVVEIT